MDTATFRTIVAHRPMTPERRAAAIRQHVARGGVLEPASVQAEHARQRHEPPAPPAPWTLAIEARRAASGTPDAGSRRCTCEHGIPKPWSAALEARRASAGTPVAAVSRSNAEPPRPWSLAVERLRAAGGRR